jgi:type IV pilus assembly protein PilB
MARKKLGEVLVQAGLLDEQKLRVALREQQRWGGPLGRHLLELHLVREEDLVRALAMQLNFPVAPDLVANKPTDQVLDLLPLDFCEEHSLVPFHIDGKFLDVALCDPTNLAVLDEIRIRTKLNVRPHITGPHALERALSKHYKGIDLEVPQRPNSNMMGAVLNTPAQGMIAGVRYVDFRSDPNMQAVGGGSPAATPALEAVVEKLQKRVGELESFLARDEAVIRKLLGLLVETGVFTREQILACLQD